MKKYELKSNEINLYKIIFVTTTSDTGWDEDRLFLLEDMPNTERGNVVLAEGGHCSCYDFDEVVWSCWELSYSELEKLLEKSSSYDKCRLYLRRYLKDN